MNPIKYIREVRRELGQVTWPSRKSTLDMTYVVIISSVVVGIYVGGLDYLFSNLLSLLLRQ